MAAYLLDERRHGVVVSDGAFAAVLDAVGHPTGFDESLHAVDDKGVVLAFVLFVAVMVVGALIVEELMQ